MKHIGQVVSLTGRAVAESGQGIRDLSAGVPVSRSETIRTEAGGSVQVRFEDDSLLDLGPGSSMALRDFAMDSGTGSNIRLQAGFGGFRFVTGRIAEQNPRGVNIETPWADISVRGAGLEALSHERWLEVGIFDYHRFDVVLTTETGTYFLTEPGVLIRIMPDGSLAMLLPYSPAERAVFGDPVPISLSGEEEEGGSDHPDQDAGDVEESEHAAGPVRSGGDFPVFGLQPGLFETAPVLLEGNNLTPTAARPVFRGPDLQREAQRPALREEEDDDPPLEQGEAGAVRSGVAAGGADVLSGGPGDDLLMMEGHDEVHGGGGDDTLGFEDGLHIDLTSVNAPIISGIEHIDMTGAPDSLTLSEADVAGMPDSGVLTVHGDAGDQVTVTGGPWTYLGAEDGFHGFSSGAATLKVQDGLLMDISLILGPFTGDAAKREAGSDEFPVYLGGDAFHHSAADYLFGGLEEDRGNLFDSVGGFAREDYCLTSSGSGKGEFWSGAEAHTVFDTDHGGIRHAWGTACEMRSGDVFSTMAELSVELAEADIFIY